MSVFVLEDLCFNLRSLPPNEAMVPVVSKAMLDSAVYREDRAAGNRDADKNRGALGSFVSRCIE
jgi:hypothetical protein